MYFLSLLAGLLTSISPCVLPVLPLIAGSAMSEHRLAPVSLMSGLIVSFTALGLLLTTLGTSLGLDESLVRSIAAFLMIFFGLAMFVPQVRALVDTITAPLAGRANDKLARGKFSGLHGHFGLGILLGAVWSPCVGPTLGAAIGMASQRENLLQSGIVMFLFGVGASIPLLAISYSSRSIFKTSQSSVIAFGEKAKPVLGMVLLLVGVIVLTGVDKKIEVAVLDILPGFWVDLITRF
jgi:cytochrome c-type biogenesis protein